MTRSHDTPMRLLVAEDDEGIADSLRLVLEDVGYTVVVASSLAEALAVIDAQVFHFILTDLFSRSQRDALGSVQVLRERAAPTPVGVMTGWRVSADEVAQAGFACLIPKPFEIQDLLTHIAACMGARARGDETDDGTAHDTEQVRVVRRYFAALTARDWDALARLCTPDVTYVLPGEGLYAGTITGRAAFRAYAEEVFAGFPAAHFDRVLIYVLPHGLAARYTAHWRTAEQGDALLAGAVVFQFVGDLISQIGVRVNEDRLKAFTRS